MPFRQVFFTLYSILAFLFYTLYSVDVMKLTTIIIIK